MPRHPKLLKRRDKYLKERMKSKSSWQSKESVEENHSRFYNGKPWKSLRNLKLYNDPDCEYHDFFFPKDKGIVIPAVEVDHYKSITDRPDLALDYDNLKSTCFKCHRKKTVLDKLTVRFAKDSGGKVYGIEKQDKLNDFNNSMDEHQINKAE